MLYDLYIIIINDGEYVGDMINILCCGLLLTLMKTLCQQIVGAYEEGYGD